MRTYGPLIFCSGMRSERGRLGGDAFDNAVLGALHRGSLAISESAWCDKRMAARIDRVLRSVGKKRGGTSVQDSLWQPITCHISAADKRSGRYIPYFLSTEGSGPVLFRGIAEKLPEIRRLEITGSVEEEAGDSRKGKRKADSGGRSSKWRKSKTCKVRTGALGILKDAIASGKGAGNAAVLSTALEDVATGLAIRMFSEGLRDIETLEQVQKVVRKTMAADIEIVDLSADIGDIDDIMQDAGKVRDAMVADLFDTSSDEEPRPK